MPYNFSPDGNLSLKITMRRLRRSWNFQGNVYELGKVSLILYMSAILYQIWVEYVFPTSYLGFRKLFMLHVSSTSKLVMHFYCMHYIYINFHFTCCYCRLVIKRSLSDGNILGSDSQMESTDVRDDQLSSEEAKGGNKGLSDSTPQIQTFKSPLSYCRSGFLLSSAHSSNWNHYPI